MYKLQSAQNLDLPWCIMEGLSVMVGSDDTGEERTEVEGGRVKLSATCQVDTGQNALCSLRNLIFLFSNVHVCDRHHYWLNLVLEPQGRAGSSFSHQWSRLYPSHVFSLRLLLSSPTTVTIAQAAIRANRKPHRQQPAISRLPPTPPFLDSMT